MSTAPNPLVGTPNPAMQQAQTAQAMQSSPEPAPISAPEGVGGPQRAVPSSSQTAAMNPAAAKVIKAGLGWHSLMGNHTEYEQTANGPVPYQKQNSAQQLFRSILSGAILGAAGGVAGSKENAGSGWAAAARGAAAAKQGQQQQEEKQQQQAQQQFENTQKANQESREDTLQRAQLAMWHHQQVLEQHKSDFADQEYNDKKNEASQIAFNAVKQAGGVPPADGSLPASIDAYELAQKYTDTKGQIAKAPSGYHRIFFDTTNGGEAERAPVSGQWTENGKPVDMTTKTSFRVLDVPEDSLNKKSPTNPKVVNDLLGHQTYPEDGPPMMLSPNDIINMALKKKQLDAEANANARAQDDKIRDQYKAAEDTFRFTQDSLTGKLAELKAETNPDQNEIQKLEAQQDQNLADFTTTRNSLYPSLKGKPITVAPPPSPPNADAVSGVLDKVINTWAPPSLKPAISVYLKGGPIGNITVSAPTTFDEFTRNLADSQSKLPQANKLTPAQFDSVVQLGKSYFENLPKAQQAQADAELAKKMSLVKAKNPGKDIKPEDLDNYNALGDNIQVPPIGKTLQ